MVLGVPFYAQTCPLPTSTPVRSGVPPLGPTDPLLLNSIPLTRREGAPSRFEEGSKEGEPGHHAFLSSCCIPLRTPPSTILVGPFCPLSRGPLHGGKEGTRERRNKTVAAN